MDRGRGSLAARPAFIASYSILPDVAAVHAGRRPSNSRAAVVEGQGS